MRIYFMHPISVILKIIIKVKELMLLFCMEGEKTQKDFSNLLEFYFIFSIVIFFLIYLKYKEIEYSRISSKRIIKKIWY